jgi:hypothetical protein
MICSHSTFSFMIMIKITLVLIPLLGNAQKIPTIRCPFNISCNHHNQKIIELPAYPVPIKLIISHINYTSQVLEARDPENCLPRLLLHSNFSSAIFPFRIIDGSGLHSQFDEFTNISFFDCSSLQKDYQMYGDEQQDMISCPIYMAAFEDDMVELNLVFCTKLSQRVLPLIRYFPVESYNGLTIRQTSISLSWLETNFDKGCFKCKNKSKKIILSSAGEIHSLQYFHLV